MKLIDKDTLLMEIDKRKIGYNTDGKHTVEYNTVKKILDILDTLEVKEVDLDFMLHEYWNISPKITIDCLESATMTKDEMINFAKHFFELGMAVSNKAQKGE